ncbi:sodium:proton antiporter, partial [bacterium]
AERLHVSPIIATVVYAMILGHYWPSQQSPRDRVHAYAVWEASIFVLNVAAFLIMGLQARTILVRLPVKERWNALFFSLAVLVIVIVVRLLWVMTYGLLIRKFRPPSVPLPSVSAGLLVSWCGMRGLVTLATAFSLPSNFPGRDIIVLSAFTVVLGTLVLQGLTLEPLIKKLKIQPDVSYEADMSSARTAIMDAALEKLQPYEGATADAVRSYYEAARTNALDKVEPQAATEHDNFKMKAIEAQRQKLAQLRLEGSIDDDIFHALEEELDWAQLEAAPVGKYEILSV